MGRSTTDGLSCNDDVVKLLGDLIDHLAEGPALLLGHSYGAYLARGIAAQRPDLVLGLALRRSCRDGAGTAWSGPPDPSSSTSGAVAGTASRLPAYLRSSRSVMGSFTELGTCWRAAKPARSARPGTTMRRLASSPLNALARAPGGVNPERLGDGCLDRMTLGVLPEVGGDGAGTVR